MFWRATRDREPSTKPRKRGGKAGKRGLSCEQVPVLVAADRNGTTFSTVLPVVNADTLKQAISPVVDRDIVLVSDGHRGYRPARQQWAFATKPSICQPANGPGAPFIFRRSTAATAN